MDRPDAPDEQPDWQWSGPAQAGYLFAGVILPAACFVAAKGFTPDWQSGDLADYATLLLSWKAARAFYPLLLYCMTSMTLMVVAPERFCKFLLIRFGIYTGVVLACQYFLILIFASAHTVGWPFQTLVAPTVALGIWGFTWSLCRVLDASVSDRSTKPIILFAVVTVFLCMTMPPLLFFLPAAGSTTWAIIAYAFMTYRIIQHRGGRWQYSLAQLLGLFSWFAVYFGAWRLSVRFMLEEYAKLPTTAPPGCYVCTAAARGHRRIVGAEEVLGPSGGALRVNDQMRHLKCFELVWAKVDPHGHRACRWCYDRIGPVAATLLVHPLLADLTYLALKPPEWIARAALAVVLPGSGELARRLYSMRF